MKNFIKALIERLTKISPAVGAARIEAELARRQAAFVQELRSKVL